MIFRIADIYFSICQKLIVDNSYAKFCVRSKNENKRFAFDVEVMDVFQDYHTIQSFGEVSAAKNVFRMRQDVFLVDEYWKTGKVLYPYFDSESVSAFILQMFYSHAVGHQFLQMHSSLIKENKGNSGLMFLGPSGIGKTTQAELWHKYRDSLIINGDMVFVQETPEAFLGWGTPWHGSSPYCENTSVPVKALVVLKQAPENSIRELTGFEKVTAVSSSVFYPRWLENGMELCLETLDHLLTALPVYELSCRPDEDAVRLTEEKIFGNL